VTSIGLASRYRPFFTQKWLNSIFLFTTPLSIVHLFVITIKSGQIYQDSATKKPTKICLENLPQGNGPKFDEILLDISVSKYDFVCGEYQQQTFLGYFVGHIIKA
jgi:hypothetical protein